MTVTLDYSAFSAPVTKAEVDAWRTAAKASGKPWARVHPAVIVVLALFLPVMLLLIALPTSGLIYQGMQSGSSFSLVLTTVMTVVLVLFVLGMLAFLIVRVARGRNWERWMRLDRFAQSNGMTFSPSDPNPQYPGYLFKLGGSRTAVEHMMSSTGRFFDMGNFSYTVQAGKTTVTIVNGFLAFNLDRRLPNMVLDAHANNGLFGSNLPVALDRSQVLHLEGDFDKYFTLYCPKQYETDALYVFTPDLMALLIDEAAPFDVEVIDNWMFVYASHAFSMTWPGVYQRLFQIMETVGAKTLTQTDHYSDERVGNFAANVVAPPGQRLRRRFPTALVVILGIFVILPLLGMLALSISALVQ